MDEARKVIHILEHQETEVESLEKAVVYFDSDHKPDRDHYVVATFLKCLGIDFRENEIAPNPVQDHPVDIYYKDARFQITEILDKNRKRHKEYKDRLRKVKNSPDFEDFIRSYDLFDLELTDVIDITAKHLLHHKYRKYPSDVRSTLDILVYVNLKGRMLNTEFPLTKNGDLCSQGWRSVSILFKGDYGIVVSANNDAPEFIKDVIPSAKEAKLC